MFKTLADLFLRADRAFYDYIVTVDYCLLSIDAINGTGFIVGMTRVPVEGAKNQPVLVEKVLGLVK